MPTKSTNKKKTSTAKTSAKKKTASRKPAVKKTTKPKKPTNADLKRKEIIAGIVMCVVGLFVLVCAFQPPITGIVGPAIKSAFIGAFGSLGYILPMLSIALGFVMIFKKSIGIRWGQVIIWTVFFLSAALFYHIFFLRQIFKVKIADINFTEMTYGNYIGLSYNYGINSSGSSGALGGILSYWLLRNIGIFGAVFIPSTYMLIVLIVKNRTVLGEFINNQKARMEENIELRRKMETPLEKMASAAPGQESSRRKIPVNDSVAAPNSMNKKGSLRILKDKKQNLYVEDLKNSPEAYEEDKELNTDFLIRNNKHTLSSASQEKYTVDENQWNYALEQEHIQKNPSSRANSAPVSDNKPTIQISMTDAEDYKNDTPSTAKHAKMDEEYKFPPLDLIAFSNNKHDATLRAECHANAIRLEETLASFRIEAKVINITCGPTVTRYELRPAPGIRVAKINGLSKDLAMSLAATSVRIEAPIPNKNAVGIEVPNRSRSLVGLRDILEGSKFKTASSPLTICVGKDITGRNIVADLAKMPHMLVAGATGSGKSVFINSLILSLIYKSSPRDVRFIMVDPKKVELNVYNGIPHLLIPVVTKASLAASALNWAVKEMMKRYDTFAENGVRNLDAYNKLAKTKSNMETLPRIVIIVDELADLMQVASAEVEDAIYRLAQLARAAGMHLVIATQRPDVKVITGTIKANIPCRVAFSVNQLVDSRTILDGSGAEHLLGNGDMLFKFTGKPIRLQGAFVDDKEVEKVCKFLKAEGVTYDNNVMEDVKKIEKQSQGDSSGSGGDNGSEFDNLLPEAVKVIYDNEKASTSMVQRKLRVGYNRAARIIDDLERVGVVGPADGSKPREILVTYGTALQIVSGESDE